VNSQLKQLLEYLERIIDPVRQESISRLHQKTLTWETVPRPPLIINYPLPENFAFKPFPHHQIFDDPEKMLFNELVYAFETSIAAREYLDDDLPCTIRANYGTVVIASLFGAHVEQRADNPPWARPKETWKEFLSVLDRDPLDFRQGWCPRVVDTYQLYRQFLAPYPVLRNTLRIVLPDLQGPFDTLELLRGSDVFLKLKTKPDTLDKVLDRIATAQIGFAKHLLKYIQEGPPGFAHQHNMMIRGNILIRNDSAIMISAPMYRHQIAPYDERVLQAMGEGGIHSCGNFEHLIPEYLTLPSLRCIDFGQSCLNDMDTIYYSAKTRKIPLTRVSATEEELVTGSIRKRFPTGATLIHQAASLTEARRVMSAYMSPMTVNR